jgi:y4mF family transcriptional regulator
VEIRTPSALGALIRARRRELKLDQATLAALAGVSRPWLSAVEKGKPTAEIGLVLRALAALGLILDVRPEGAERHASTPTQSNLPQIDVDRIVSSSRKSRP